MSTLALATIALVWLLTVGACVGACIPREWIDGLIGVRDDS